jgi:predicted nucleic acid-binding protein
LKVLIDTPIWSNAFRSGNEKYEGEIRQLISLIEDQRALIIGPIRQEILSGYSDVKKFEKIREKLSYFENIAIAYSDYLRAAEFSNTCRKKGIQGSPIDFLICAVAHRVNAPIFTTDRDFHHFHKVIPITLYKAQ